jgi:transposase
MDKVTYNYNMNIAKHRALSYFLEGKSNREIADKVNWPYQTVTFWINKLRVARNKNRELPDYNVLFKDKPRSGRPTKVTKKVKACILKQLDDDPTTSLKELVKKVGKIKKICKQTINNFMNREGSRYKPKAKAILNNGHRDKRLKYANEMLLGGKKFLRNIIFTDESYFQLNSNRKSYFRLKDEPKRSRRYFPRKSIMIWGAISCKGTVAIQKIVKLRSEKKKFTGTKYRNLLRDQLVPAADELHGEGLWRFQQDNHKLHFTDECKELYETFALPLVRHPPCSPDLNPIETIWSIMKQRIDNECPQNEHELEACIFKVWNELTISTVKGTIYHVLKVAQEVKDMKGGYRSRDL